MTHHRSHAHRRSGGTIVMARLLGWFSIGLGVAELFAPRQVGRPVGMENRGTVLRAYGLREIATGVGLLLTRNPAPWLWGRVAGDVLDLGTLASGGRARPRNMAVAAATLATVGLVDFYCARRVSAGPASQPKPIPDYSGRSGFPRSPEAMRGAAVQTRKG